LQVEAGRDDVCGHASGRAEFDSMGRVQLPFEPSLDNDLRRTHTGPNLCARPDPQLGDRGDLTFDRTVETGWGDDVNTARELCIGSQG